MPLRGNKILSWIEQHNDGEFLAAFVGSDTRERSPATQTHTSEREARQWVEGEAGAIGVPLEWGEAGRPTR